MKESQEYFQRSRNTLRYSTPVFSTGTFFYEFSIFTHVFNIGTCLELQEPFEELRNAQEFRKLRKFFRNSGTLSTVPPEEPRQPLSVSTGSTRANFNTWVIVPVTFLVSGWCLVHFRLD